MKLLLIGLLVLACLTVRCVVLGQSLSTELTGMESCWSVSGSFSSSLGKSERLSFSGVSRIGADYLGEEEVRMLAMTNIGYSIFSGLKTTMGSIYSTSSGIKPLAGLQGVFKRDGLSLMLYPNFAIGKRTEQIVISMAQYLKNMSPKFSLVFRMQALQLFNLEEHLFSKVRLRTGIIRGKYQFGLAGDLSFEGPEFDYYKNIGVFVQYQLF